MKPLTYHRAATAALTVLSAVLVWTLHERSVLARRQDAQIQSLRRELVRTRHDGERAAARLKLRERMGPSATQAAATAGDVAARKEIQTLEWLRSRDPRNGPPSVSLTGADGALNKQLAVMLGLGPEDYGRLNAAIARTKERLDELAIQAARPRLSADRQTFVLNIPPHPQTSDPVYADLVDTFAQVLGPDRFKLFNAVSGDAFDGSFNRFGLDPVTYELTLQPELSDSTPRFKVIQSFAGADGQHSVRTTGSYSIETIKRTYPVLAHFLPPSLGKPSPSPGG